MAKRLDSNCSALAFYGFQLTESLKAQAYRKTVEWFEQVGYKPSHLHFYDAKLQGPTGVFANTAPKLAKAGFSNVEHLDIFHLAPGRRIDGRHPGLTVGFSFKPDSTQHGITECWSHMDLEVISSIFSLRCPELQSFADLMVTVLRPEYGIGYYGDSGYATGFAPYAGNVELTPEEEEYADWIGAWGNFGMPQRVYRQGLIRDVYPWNFVATRVLDAPAGKISIEKWIQQDARHGSLTRLTTQCTLWEVKDEDIPGVRKVLWDVGRIFDPNKINLPPSRLTSEELLHAALGGRAPEDAVVLRGSGEEVPTEEVKKLISKPKNKHK
jgi:hypothetical protein